MQIKEVKTMLIKDILQVILCEDSEGDLYITYKGCDAQYKVSYCLHKLTSVDKILNECLCEVSDMSKNEITLLNRYNHE